MCCLFATVFRMCVYMGLAKVRQIWPKRGHIGRTSAISATFALREFYMCFLVPNAFCICFTKCRQIWHEAHFWIIYYMWVKFVLRKFPKYDQKQIIMEELLTYLAFRARFTKVPQIWPITHEGPYWGEFPTYLLHAFRRKLPIALGPLPPLYQPSPFLITDKKNYRITRKSILRMAESFLTM